MPEWMLTDEEIEGLIGIEFKNTYSGHIAEYQAIAKAQDAKTKRELVKWLFGRCEHIKPECVGQPRWKCKECRQALKREVEKE